ncbi:2-C-methyl-D-erythritol 4-phosphate cytidylyltransferase [Neisseria leonii]|uniref:2-C-methyl-D-erythritol 4-phosphate cytidylyltransferase n=1 Tax=Neisseria leonii TaxID=2995413 RepID=UPI00237A70DA|nr:2-C-methyl-D-erythritol 4-phosphate cytidylyltransferase [Neisseria sp. 3986]MDD9324864.1 2-C-methyl-D-erythritol 4-phosphate cytidylyltransferase [Neisseria sp. 3986]
MARQFAGESVAVRRIALIPAAGVGERFGADRPKQYVSLAGQSVLAHTLTVFERHPQIDAVAVVISPQDTWFDGEIQTAAFSKLRVLRNGGASRAETVSNGLAALSASGAVADQDCVLVHDAARCCLPRPALDRLLAAVGDGGCAILALPVADTLKRSADGMIIDETVSRCMLWQAQTPQAAPAGLLRRALAAADAAQMTDEASALEAAGAAVKLVTGDSRNLKLTLPQDEYIVRLLLAHPSEDES